MGKDLKNHVWWASDACGGDVEYLIEMVNSMRSPTLNIHSNFPDQQKFTRSAREPLDELAIFELYNSVVLTCIWM